MEDDRGDLTVEGAESLRRSLAMVDGDKPSGLSAGTAWRVLDQLVRALQELRDRRRQA